MDSPLERTGKQGSGKLEHLENLYLLAQFYEPNADRAARLVDRVYRTSNAESPEREESLSELVDRMLHLADSRPESWPVTPEDVPPGRPRDAADRFLHSRVGLSFLALNPDEKLELWHGVETYSPESLDTSLGALDRFTRRIKDLMTADERGAFDSFVDPDSVSGALRTFWKEAFLPVSPTLRAVVESEERRHAGETPEPKTDDTPKSTSRTNRVRRAVFYGWVVLAAAVSGYALTHLGRPAEQSHDLVELALEASDGAEITFPTTSAEQAEVFIRDRFSWRLSTPEIDRASLSGVALIEIVPSVELPAFVFRNESDDRPIPVFALSYRLLQDHADVFELSRETLNQIQERARFDVFAMREKSAVIWRDRDDIFLAFIEENGSDFQARVRIRS